MPEETNLVAVSITKGKGTIEVDLDKLPLEVYKEALLQGLKTLLNRGMSKITKDQYTEQSATKNGFESAEAEMQAAAMAKGAENLEACKEGKIRFTGSKSATKISGAVRTEAMRLARNIVKDEIKKAGGKISHYAASDITAAAKELLDASPELIEQAKEELEKRAATPVKIAVASIPTDPKKVKAAEDKKAKAKATKGETLSAKQASMPAKRKAQSSQTAH